MRTRSQPLSPDGLQSLPTTRRRRTATATASSNISSNAEQGPSNTRRRATRQRVASQTASQPAETSEATEQNAATIAAEDQIPPDQNIPQDAPANSPRPETISEAPATSVTAPGAAFIDTQSPGVPPREDLSSSHHHIQSTVSRPTMPCIQARAII
jgi:hypothetical protein